MSEESTMMASAGEEAAANGDGAAAADGSLNKDGEGATRPSTGTGSSTIRFTDHFSLRGPSGTVRLRNNNKIRVYDQTTSQVIIEERHSDPSSSSAAPETEILVKRSDNTSFGQLALRFWYTVVATFFSGFLFIFCFQVVLFVFLNLSVEAGTTVQQPNPNWTAFVSNLFSLPVFVHGFSTAMSIAVAFCVDTWKGHTVLRTVGRRKVTVVYAEWTTFFIYLGIPLLVLTGALFAGAPNWWEISALVWYFSVFVFWCFYALMVTVIEVKSFKELVRAAGLVGDSTTGSGDGGCFRTFLAYAKCSILLRQELRYSGRLKKRYLVKSSDLELMSEQEEDGNAASTGGGSDSSNVNDTSCANYNDDNALMRIPSSKHVVHREKRGLYGRMTAQIASLSCCGPRFYELVDPPTRAYTLDEALGVRRVVTFGSWSLERIYCQKKSSRVMIVVNGDSALLPSQAKSSLACSILGYVMVILLIASLLLWLGLGSIVAGVAVLLGILCCIPSFKGIYTAYRAYNMVHTEESEPDTDEPSAIENGDIETSRGFTNSESDNDPEEESNALYSFREEFKVTKPTAAFSWVLFSLEVFAFVIWPFIALCVVKNWQSASLFAIVAVFSYVRFFLCPSVVLETIGSLDAFDANTSLGKRKKMVSKTRLNEIISTISRGRSRHIFAFVFSIFVVLLLFLTVGALNLSTNESTGATIDLGEALSDFEYPPQPDLPYPTCRLKKGLDITESDEGAALSDFVFAASITYYNQRQDMLDTWFGEGVAKDEMDVVLGFKKQYRGEAASAAMFLYSYPDVPGFGTIAIRGTQSSWDMLANARLWSAAFLAQCLRYVLPFGDVWTPILDELVWLVTVMDSPGMADVSYYEEVSAFANYLLDSGNYTNLVLVGHSLGGGIALISGAQTGLTSIGISAPNALLSRHTFGITEQALKTHTFNVIPNRDPVPKIDDVSDLYQRIECRTEPNNFLGCHDSGRTLCELQYMCGSGDRPVICSCVQKFGYPKPTQIGNRTFEEACIEA